MMAGLVKYEVACSGGTRMKLPARNTNGVRASTMNRTPAAGLKLASQVRILRIPRTA